MTSELGDLFFSSFWREEQFYQCVAVRPWGAGWRRALKGDGVITIRFASSLRQTDPEAECELFAFCPRACKAVSHLLLRMSANLRVRH
jgi:hypothetical protein